MQTQTAVIARYPRVFTIASSPSNASSLQDTTKVKVEYAEYQAFGKPHHHLGVLGDIYVDLTKGNHALYGKADDGWRRWPGPGQRKASVPHPNYASHVLWCKVESKSLGWISQKAITGRILVSSASQVIDIILSHRLSAHQKELKKANRAGGHIDKRPRLSDASNSADIGPSSSCTAADRVATDVSFSVPPGPHAVPVFIDRSSLPDGHPPQIAESKTQTQTETGTAVTKRKAARQSIIADPNQIVQAADWSDLEGIENFLMTMVKTANGLRGACPASNSVSVSCQPLGSPHPPAAIANSPKKNCSSESGRKRKWEPEPEPEPSSRYELDPALESMQRVEGCHQAVVGPEIDPLFTPLPSPIPDSNQVTTTPSLSPRTGPDLANVLPSPKPESKELEARASSQLPEHLHFTPSPSPKPASELPGPNLAHIFTPTASPQSIPSPEPELSAPRSVTHTTSTKLTSSIEPSPASSSTLSTGTGSCNRSDGSRSVSKSSISTSAPKSFGTKPDKRSNTPLSRCSRSPVESPKTPKTPKTPRTPEKRKVASPDSKKVPSVKKPVITRPDDDDALWPMDVDDDFSPGRATSLFGEDRDEPTDGVGDAAPAVSISRNRSRRPSTTSNVPSGRASPSNRKPSASTSKKDKDKSRVTRRVSESVSFLKVLASTPSRTPAARSEIEVEDLTLLDSDSESGSPVKPRSKRKGKTKEVKEEEGSGDSDSDIVITDVKWATGKRCIPAVTLSPTKLKLKERKWKTRNPSPASPSSSFSSSHAESSLGPGSLKVMPRMKDRRPSKRTATIDRKPLKTKLSSVIDLTMESDESEGEEERERRNMRPLLVCRAARSGGDAESARVVLKQEPGDDGGEGDNEEEMGVTDGGDPMVENDAWGDAFTGDAGEAANVEREESVPLQDVLSTGVIAGGETVESAAAEDDKMVEGPPAEEPACEPQAPSPPHPPTTGPPLVEDELEHLPTIAAVDELLHHSDADTDTETLDGDVEMGDVTMIGQDDDDAKTIDDDEEVDELDPDSDLDLGGEEEDARWSDFHLDIVFGSEDMRSHERYCRACLIQKDQWWIIKIKEDPQARWSVVRRKAIRHYTSNHWQESEYVLSREANELQDMAHSFK